MPYPLHDPCCWCMSLKVGLRIVAGLKFVLSVLFVVASLFLAILSQMKSEKSDDESAVATPFGLSAAFVEFVSAILSVVLIFLAGKPIAAFISCAVMSALSFVHGVALIVVTVRFIPFPFYGQFFIGVFVPSALVTLYLTFIGWGMWSQQKWKETHPEEEEEATSGGTQVNYTAAPVYGQPSQVMQPPQTHSYGMMDTPVYAQPYSVQSYPTPQSYPA